MSQLDEPSYVDQVLDCYYAEAWKLYFDKKGPEPELCSYHKAGAHIILAHSPDVYVYHAQEALKIYEAMYTDTDSNPTEEQLTEKRALIEEAQAVLEEALEKEIEYGRDEESDEELDERFDKEAKRLEESTKVDAEEGVRSGEVEATAGLENGGDAVRE